jgi:hypothetical protein
MKGNGGIPELVDGGVKKSMNAEEYKTYRNNASKKPFFEGIKLSFTIEDIKYLLVMINKDIPSLIAKIRSSSLANDISSILKNKIITLTK